MNTFAEKFKTLRECRGLSSYAVEEKTGIDDSNLLKFEKGTGPMGNNKLKILAKLYKTEYERLKVWKILSKLTKRELEILKEEINNNS